MDKYKGLFIEESREHLSELSRILVRVESATDRVALVDEIFRHVHSVKGMAASMRYDAISILAHKMEDVVGIHRREKRPFSAERIDLLLKGVDALGTQIQAVADNASPLPAQELVDLLMQAAAAGQPVAPAPPESAAKAPTENSGLWVKVGLSKECQAPSVRGFMLHRQLGSATEILSCDPPMETLRGGKWQSFELKFQIKDTVDQAVIKKILSSVSDVESVVFGPIQAPLIPAPGPQNITPTHENTGDGPTLRVRAQVLDDLLDTVGELFISREQLRIGLGTGVKPDIRALLDNLGKYIREVHAHVMAARMMPIQTLTERYPRLVRDVARNLGKSVELKIQGAEIELDRALIERLDGPMVHAIRNAVDHGIETPADRARQNKEPTGRILITAQRDRDSVVISIEDDGRGIDPELLRRLAVEKEIMTAEAAAKLDDRAAQFLICLPGFSTKHEVSEVSGRGVGMDVVRSQVETLGGTLDIESEIGKKTRFVFRLPLTLAIVPALLIEIGGCMMALPAAKVAAVRDILLFTGASEGDAPSLRLPQGGTPVLDLASALKLPSDSIASQSILVEEGRDRRLIIAHRIIGFREVVVKPLGEPLDRLEWFSGAAIVGDGQPVLMLDAPRIFRAEPTWTLEIPSAETQK